MIRCVVLALVRAGTYGVLWVAHAHKSLPPQPLVKPPVTQDALDLQAQGGISYFPDERMCIGRGGVHALGYGFELWAQSVTTWLIQREFGGDSGKPAQTQSDQIQAAQTKTYQGASSQGVSAPGAKDLHRIQALGDVVFSCGPATLWAQRLEYDPRAQDAQAFGRWILVRVRPRPSQAWEPAGRPDLPAAWHPSTPHPRPLHPATKDKPRQTSPARPEAIRTPPPAPVQDCSGEGDSVLEARMSLRYQAGLGLISAPQGFRLRHKGWQLCAPWGQAAVTPRPGPVSGPTAACHLSALDVIPKVGLTDLPAAVRKEVLPGAFYAQHPSDNTPAADRGPSDRGRSATDLLWARARGPLWAQQGSRHITAQQAFYHGPKDQLYAWGDVQLWQESLATKSAGEVFTAGALARKAGAPSNARPASSRAPVTRAPLSGQPGVKGQPHFKTDRPPSQGPLHLGAAAPPTPPQMSASGSLMVWDGLRGRVTLKGAQNCPARLQVVNPSAFSSQRLGRPKLGQQRAFSRPPTRRPLSTEKESAS